MNFRKELSELMKRCDVTLNVEYVKENKHILLDYNQYENGKSIGGDAVAFFTDNNEITYKNIEGRTK